MSNVKDFRFLLYKVEQEDVIVKAFIQNETLWLTQKSMAELFGVNKSTISRHLKNIYEEKELVEHSTVAFFATVTRDFCNMLQFSLIKCTPIDVSFHAERPYPCRSAFLSTSRRLQCHRR